MEEVRCPGCGGMIPFPEEKTPVCPRCGRGIDVVDGGDGMWIMGLRQPPPQPSPATPHENDPLVRKYAKWIGAGVLVLSIGLACGAILFIDLWTSYFGGGAIYFGLGEYILVGVGIVLFLGGGALLLAGWSFREDRLRRLDIKTE